MVGRMTVCALSQSESTYGILSATNSTARSTPTKTRTSVRCSAEGVSASPVRPISPTRKTTPYALSPEAHPLAMASGSVSMAIRRYPLGSCFSRAAHSDRSTPYTTLSYRRPPTTRAWRKRPSSVHPSFSPTRHIRSFPDQVA